MKDDERYLLGASQAEGEFVPLDGMRDDICNMFFLRWTQLNWIDPDTGELTAKGKSAKGAKVPDEVAIEPVELEAMVDTQSANVVADWDENDELPNHIEWDEEDE